MGFPCSSVGKESACNAEDLGLIPGSGRFPGEGNDNPLQYSCLENPKDCSLPRSSVHGVARVGHDLATKLPAGSNWASLVAQLVKNLPTMQETWVRLLGWEGPLEKEMETHSSILAWKIPWTLTLNNLQL